MYVCVGVWYIHATARVWRLENKSEVLVPHFHRTGARNRTQAVRLDCKCFYPLDPK